MCAKVRQKIDLAKRKRIYLIRIHEIFFSILVIITLDGAIRMNNLLLSEITLIFARNFA